MSEVLHIKRTPHHPSVHCPNLSRAYVVHICFLGGMGRGIRVWVVVGGGGVSFSKQQVLVIFVCFRFVVLGGGGVGRTNDDADVGSDAVWVI